MKMNISDKVINVLSSYRNLKEVHKLLEEGDTLAPLALNSIEFIKFVTDLELEFKINWKDEDLYFERFESFSYLLNYIEERYKKNED